MVLRESGTCWGRDQSNRRRIVSRVTASSWSHHHGCRLIAASAALWRVGKLRVIEFVPDSVILLCKIALVCLHYVVHHLWILLLLCLRNAIICEHSLPIFRQTCKLTSLIVIANMYHVDRILRRRYLDRPWRAHYAIHEARKPTLFAIWPRRFAQEHIARKSLRTDRSIAIIGPRRCNFGHTVFPSAKRLRIA